MVQGRLTMMTPADIQRLIDTYGLTQELEQLAFEHGLQIPKPTAKKKKLQIIVLTEEEAEAQSDWTLNLG